MPPHTPEPDVCRALPRVRVYRVLTGACNPTLCPIYASLGLGLIPEGHSIQVVYVVDPTKERQHSFAVGICAAFLAECVTFELAPFLALATSPPHPHPTTSSGAIMGRLWLPCLSVIGCD